MFRTVPLSIIRNFLLYTQHCCMSYRFADSLRASCPKHVEFYSESKFEKLVHLVCFIIRICQDARSAERQKLTSFRLLYPSLYLSINNLFQQALVGIACIKQPYDENTHIFPLLTNVNCKQAL